MFLPGLLFSCTIVKANKVGPAILDQASFNQLTCMILAEFSIK